MEPLVRAEADLSIEIGMPAEYLTAAQVKADLPDSIDPKGAVLFRDQAAFNPITYCVNLAVSWESRFNSDAKRRRRTMRRFPCAARLCRSV